MVRTFQQAVEVLTENRQDFERLGVERLGLFGSFARGIQTEISDIDILVDFQPGRKSFRSFMSVVERLEKLLGRRVDVVTPESLSPYLRTAIIEEAKYVKVA